MSWRPGEPHEFSATTRARVFRQFERDLESDFPGYRFKVVSDDEPDADEREADDA